LKSLGQIKYFKHTRTYILRINKARLNFDLNKVKFKIKLLAQVETTRYVQSKLKAPALQALVAVEWHTSVVLIFYFALITLKNCLS
jgi:hypothetical protein